MRTPVKSSSTPLPRAVGRALAAASLLLPLATSLPQAQAGDNPVAGSGQTRFDRPLNADRPGAHGLGRGTVNSGAARGTPKPGSGDPDRLGAKGSPYNSRSSGRLKAPGLEGLSITGGSVTRDGATRLPD